MSSFAAQNIAITGAGSGIGRALALKLARQGARLALSDIDEGGLETTGERVRERGARVELLKVDVSSFEQVQAWIADAEASLGPTDMLINNAGVTLVDRVLTQSLEDIHWIMNINFWGVVHGVQAVLPGMRARGRGTLVNLSSLFGLLAVPSQSAYNASKFAVRGYTEALAAEERRHGIHVACVHPGGIRTGIARNARFRAHRPGGQNKDRFVSSFERMARTTAEQAADIILAGVAAKRSRILVGPDARLLDKIQRLFPADYLAVMRRLRLA